MKCLYCHTECGENYFCVGGGATLERSNTGEGFVSKSYCYNDFLTHFKASKSMRLGYTKDEQQLMLWSSDIKEWYEHITFMEDNSEKRVVEND